MFESSDRFARTVMTLLATSGPNAEAWHGLLPPESVGAGHPSSSDVTRPGTHWMAPPGRMPVPCEPRPDRPDRSEMHERMAFRHRPEASEFDRMARLLWPPGE